MRVQLKARWFWNQPSANGRDSVFEIWIRVKADSTWSCGWDVFVFVPHLSLAMDPIVELEANRWKGHYSSFDSSCAFFLSILRAYLSYPPHSITFFSWNLAFLLAISSSERFFYPSFLQHITTSFSFFAAARFSFLFSNLYLQRQKRDYHFIFLSLASFFFLSLSSLSLQLSIT